MGESAACNVLLTSDRRPRKCRFENYPRQKSATEVQLFDKRFVVVTGKGGVGKSTVVAALALCAARAGKRVLCCEVNAKERIAPLLGARLTGSVIQEAVCGIYTVNVMPRDAMREYALMKLRFEAVYKTVFENRLVSHFLRMVPSLAETVMLGKTWYEVEAKTNGRYKWDMVLLDAPATGHGISLLRVPRTLLDTVPPGPMRDDAEKMQATISDPTKTRVDLVTLPEEMPVNETLELEEALREDLQLPLGFIHLNGFVEKRFSDEERRMLRAVAEPESPAGETPLEPRPGTSASPGRPVHLLEPAVAAARAGLYQASRAERSANYERKLREASNRRPILRLPLLHSASWGREQVEMLASFMAGEQSCPRGAGGVP